jgi:hypothetical protein
VRILQNNSLFLLKKLAAFIGGKEIKIEKFNMFAGFLPAINKTKTIKIKLLPLAVINDLVLVSRRFLGTKLRFFWAERNKKRVKKCSLKPSSPHYGGVRGGL